MTDRQNIPQDDRDLKLAREVGRRLDAGSDFSGTDTEDLLLDLLQEYKIDLAEKREDERADSATLWNSIEQKIKPHSSSNNIHKMSVQNKGHIWSAAAAILIIITAGLIYFIHSSEPALVAETGKTVQSFTLHDGSIVTLRPHSKIFLTENDRNHTEYRLTGEAHFDVESNPDRTFSVSAGNGRVSVLGTTFVLSSWGDLVQVYLQEGSVQFETEDHTNSTILKPGQYASITGNTLTEPQEAEKEMYTDWLNEELSFNNQTVRYVFSELEQHFNISLKASRQISETRIGGSLSLESLQASLNDLGMVLGGSFESTGKKQYRFKEKQ